MNKIIACVLNLLIASAAFSQEAKDTIFFSNGNILIGKLKSIKLGLLNFDPDGLGDVSVKLPDLRSITAARTVFRIETIEDSVMYGRLISSQNNHVALVVSGVDTFSLELEHISVMYPYTKSFLQRFSGNVGTGFSYSRSSQFGQMNFNGKLNYASKRQEISIAASGIYSLTDSSFSRDREDASLTYNHYFSPTWFGMAFIAYQRNLELGLERRYQEGLGIGNKYITSKHVYAWAGAGTVANQEKNLEGVSTGTLAELFGQLQFNFFRFTKPEVNFVLSETFYYSLSQSGRFRNDGQVDLSWEIVNNFDLNITFYHNYDNQPLGLAGNKFDFGTVIGISYTFYH